MFFVKGEDMNKKQREKAAYFDRGLVSKKGVYFHTSSDFAKEHLFFLAWGGEFLCDSTYEINRRTKEQFLDYYLIFSHIGRKPAI